jgi:hypothetical protein
VTFMPPAAPPGSPPNQFSGLYLLEVTAPNEGTISISQTIYFANHNPVPGPGS